MVRFTLPSGLLVVAGAAVGGAVDKSGWGVDLGTAVDASGVEGLAVGGAVDKSGWGVDLGTAVEASGVEGLAVVGVSVTGGPPPDRAPEKKFLYDGYIHVCVGCTPPPPPKHTRARARTHTHTHTHTHNCPW